VVQHLGFKSYAVKTRRRKEKERKERKRSGRIIGGGGGGGSNSSDCNCRLAIAISWWPIGRQASCLMERPFVAIITKLRADLIQYQI